MKSEFSVGLADKICATWDDEGGTPAELNGFAENNALVRGVLAVVRDKAVIKPIQPPTLKPEFRFKVGRKIKLGLLKTPEQYHSVLEEIGVHVNMFAGQILKQVTVSKTVIEVDLSEPFTVADLGFTAVTRYDAIKKRIVELGGGICPNEVGPATRFQYQDQPKGEWFWVAMEPLSDADRDLDVFLIEHDDDGLWLDSDHGNPHTLYHPDSHFVCVVPCKK